MLSRTQLGEAELAFLNAPFDPDGWRRAIERLASATRSRLVQLCGGEVGGGLDFNFFSDECHDPHRHLVNPDLYGPGNWRINCSQGARTIQHEQHYAAYRAAVPAGYYDDAVSDLDLPYGCQTALMLDSNGLFGLALLRSSKDGPCDAGVVDGFRTVARQAHRALRAQIALGEEAAELMVANVAGRREATILLDRFANVLAMTEAAEQLFEGTGALALRGLRLALPHADEDRAMNASFARLLAGDLLHGPMLHDTVVGRSPAFPQGRWRLVAVRLPGGGEMISFQPRLAVTVSPL